MKQDDCIMCQTVDDLAPSKSYCPDHKHTNEGKSMKQDDVREDWEKEFDFLTWNWIIFSEPNGDKNYGFNVLKDFIRSLLASHSTSLLQKMEGIRKVSKYASWFRKGDDNVKYGNRELKGYKKALSDCMAIIKKEGVL